MKNNTLKAANKIARLKAELESEQKRMLLSLPEEVGLASIDELISALWPLSTPAYRARLGKRVKAQSETEVSVIAVEKPTTGGKRRKRARLSKADKAKVVEELKAGKKTIGEIAKEWNISAATANTWKAQAGLTKKRKK